MAKDKMKPPAAKEAKKPSKNKKPPSSETSPISRVGAVAIVGVGIAAALVLGAPDLVQRMKASLPGAVLATVAPAVGQRKAELSERERLQQGHPPAKGKRSKCSDASRTCESEVSEEACASDARLAQRCCRACHVLTCVDKHEDCEEWAFGDQCLDNPDFMKANCCWSCTPDPDDSCAIDPSDRPDVYKGDINKIFERILVDYPQYTPTVHSRDPWLLQMDNLLSDDECAGIIEAVGGKHGEYIKPSTTAKPVRQPNGQVVLTDVPDQIRTSHNAWCQHRGCYDHPVHETVIQRIMSIVGLHPNNAEHMQLLRYGHNEYYRLHHDWIPEQLDAACGPRAFTFFLYLSDVEEGGGTNFPYLNVTVQPKKGSAVLWPHGLNSDPRIKDTRTHHEAMPVVKGQKWGANYWIHGRDFKTSMATGCDGRQGQPKRSRMMKKGAAEQRLKEDAGQRQGR